MRSSCESYYNYLQTRRLSGLLYRKWWLYPKLCRHLFGQVLDIGCGLGDMLAFRPGTVGIDVNPETVDWCRSCGLDAHLMQPDQLPFPSSTFDGVILDNVLEHLIDPVLLLMEVRRVVVSGGVLLVGVPGRRGYERDSDHKMFYDEETLIRCLSQVGFRKKKLFYMPFYSTWLGRHLRSYCIYGVFSRL
jgi:SAM-dependent methyltransferase